MKTINKIKSLLVLSLVLVLAVGCGAKDSKKYMKTTDEAKKTTKIEFILDWVPNTNHTGLYVAKKMGYDKELGIDLDIKRPPEGSTTELIATGKAPFGINFQDYLTKRFVKNAPVTAVAAIISENTYGVISRKDANIKKASDLEGHKYGTWDDPIEKSVIAEMMSNDGGSFEKVELVPNSDDNSVTSLANGLFDAGGVYYAWDGILAKHMKVDTNFMFVKDYSDALNFYSPVIIVNNDFMKNNEEVAKNTIKAIKKGYQYAMQHPKEAADILIENAPELKDKKDFVYDSQEWLSKMYAPDASKWGEIDKKRWDAFYTYLLEKKIIDVDLTKKELFTNKLLGE